MGNDKTAGKNSATENYSPSALARWLNDPLVSRAADRSNFDHNGDVLALLQSLTEVMADIESALPGVNYATLRQQLQADPEEVDLYAMHATLVQEGRTPEEATIVCQAIHPLFCAEQPVGPNTTDPYIRDRFLRLIRDEATPEQMARSLGFPVETVEVMLSIELDKAERRGKPMEPARSVLIARACSLFGRRRAQRLLKLSGNTVVNALAQVKRLNQGLAY